MGICCHLTLKLNSCECVKISLDAEFYHKDLSVVSPDTSAGQDKLRLA